MLKRLTPFIFLVAVLALAFLTIAARPYQDNTPPVTPEPLTIPAAVELFLTAGIGFLLTNGLKSLSKALKANRYFTWFPDLSGLATTSTTMIITVLILFGNAILAAFPADWVPVARAVFQVIGVAIAAMGIHYTVKGKPPELLVSTLEEIHPPDIG